jgi:hypothetical protein
MERSKYGKILLSEQERQWMYDNFGNTKNEEVAAYLGISIRTAIRIANGLGIKKHPDFTKSMQRKASERAAIVNRVNGGNTGARNLLLYGKPYRFKAGESIRNRMGDKAFKEMHCRIGESRKETFRKEKRRVLFGLEQKTRLRVVQCPREKIYLRSNLRKHGYEIGQASNEATVGDSTRRSFLLENRAIKMGIKFNYNKKER